MKTFLVSVAAWLAFFSVSAQVTVQLATDQDEFLPGEAIPLAVKITNRSGQQIHLGEDAAWLTFSVESVDGFIVVKNSEVPVLGPFELESSQMGIKRVDIAPYFTMNRPGRYKITALLNMKAWSWQTTSPPKAIDIVTGVELWSQIFGMPTTSGLPQMRKFTLEQANYLRNQIRLYVQVSDESSSQVYKVFALGPMVTFGKPDAKIDRLSRLHVLWQTGGRTFSYAIVGPDGALVQRDTYDNFSGRPRLSVADNGDVIVVGGNRRPEPGELPNVAQPDQLPPIPSAPAAPPAPVTPPK